MDNSALGYKERLAKLESDVEHCQKTISEMYEWYSIKGHSKKEKGLWLDPIPEWVNEIWDLLKGSELDGDKEFKLRYMYKIIRNNTGHPTANS